MMSSKSKIQAVVKQIREVVNSESQPTLSSRQAKSAKKRPPTDSEWVSGVELPAPSEDDVLQALLEAVKELGDGGEDFAVPNVQPVQAEWVGHRKDSGNRTPQQQSNKEAYECLLRDCSSQVTIVFVHGGGYFQGSPDESRTTAATLARSTGGRCLSVSYRLAPQHPFPAAILDTLIAYVSLLYPPAGSLHESVAASSIILAGDSAGATICFAVVQVILQLQRRSRTSSPKINFHGTQVPLNLPAGLAALCAYGDLTHSMPSWLANLEKDHMPLINPTLWSNFPNCNIWPTSPPRVNVLCNHTVLHHPLVSPVAVPDWSGFPPLWLCYGEEMMLDEGKFIAQRASACGVKVVWEQYESMPHCFPLLPPLSRLPQSQKAFGKWADFCRTCVERPGVVETAGTCTSVEDMQETPVDLRHLIGCSLEEVKGRMERARREVADMLAKQQQARTKL